jgi:hypothetical protein
MVHGDMRRMYRIAKELDQLQAIEKVCKRK